MPGTISSGGNVLYSWLIVANFTPVSVAANTTAEQSFNLPGAQLGDFVDVYFFGATLTGSTQTAGIGIVNNRISAPGVLQVGFANTTAAPVTPNAGYYYICLSRPEVPVSLLPTNAS
jgi:hypothetical protein